MMNVDHIVASRVVAENLVRDQLGESLHILHQLSEDRLEKSSIRFRELINTRSKITWRIFVPFLKLVKDLTTSPLMASIDRLQFAEKLCTTAVSLSVIRVQYIWRLTPSFSIVKFFAFEEHKEEGVECDSHYYAWISPQQRDILWTRMSKNWKPRCFPVKLMTQSFWIIFSSTQNHKLHPSGVICTSISHHILIPWLYHWYRRTLDECGWITDCRTIHACVLSQTFGNSQNLLEKERRLDQMLEFTSKYQFRLQLSQTFLSIRVAAQTKGPVNIIVAKSNHKPFC